MNMLDIFRNLFQSKKQRQAEQLTAYLDQKLSPAERQRFEEHLQQDTTLAHQSRQQAQIKAALRQLPSRPVPRNFILQPSRYAKTKPAWNPYPILRTATAVMAILFIAVVALDSGLLSYPNAGAPVNMALEETASEPEAFYEVTRAVATDENEKAEMPALTEPAQELVEEFSIAAAPTPELDAQAPAQLLPTEVAGNGATDAGNASPPTPTPTLSPTPFPTATPQPTATPILISPSPAPVAGIRLGDLQWILGLLFLGLAVASWYFRRRY